MSIVRSEKDPKIAIQLTRQGLLVWIGLVVFIAGWMFVLGILVGRGAAPLSLNTHPLGKELAERKAIMVQKEQATVEAQASGKGGQKPELGFYEALKEAKPETGLKVKAMPGKSKKAAAAQAPRPVPKKPQAPKPKAVVENRPPHKINESSKPEAAAEPETLAKLQPLPPAAPTESVPADAKSRFTIQVAAFKELAGAEHLVADLRRRGYPAYQIRAQLNDKAVWYRVRVGAFGNKTAAGGMLKKLNADGIKGMAVGTP